jgi:hypothetical protein
VVIDGRQVARTRETTMSEQGTEFTGTEIEDTEGHLLRLIDGPDEDVEGHVQPPRGDDTDHLHS